MNALRRGLRFVFGLRYDLLVLAGAGLVAYGLDMIHPALAPIWLGAGLIFTVARAQLPAQEE